MVSWLALGLRRLSYVGAGLAPRSRDENLRDISDEITIRYQKIPAYRGMITDRFAQPLAISTPVAAIATRPDKLTDSFWPETLA